MPMLIACHRRCRLEEKTLHIQGYKCQALYHKAAGTPIVFLHGLSYSIGVWERIGVTELLIEKKVPFLALDMPYGIKKPMSPQNKGPPSQRRLRGRSHTNHIRLRSARVGRRKLRRLHCTQLRRGASSQGAFSGRACLCIRKR